MPKKPHTPVICACGSHAFAPLTHGAVHLFDTQDAELAGRWRWSANGRINNAAVRNNCQTGRKEYFHRAVLSAPSGMVVDHINGNQADNRRSNLRVCTSQENSWNRKKRVDASGQFKGVYKIGKLWRYALHVSGQTYAGSFETEKEAAIAYNDAALRAFGKFARLNAIYPDGRPATKSAVSHPFIQAMEAASETEAAA